MNVRGQLSAFAALGLGLACLASGGCGEPAATVDPTIKVEQGKAPDESKGGRPPSGKAQAPGPVQRTKGGPD